MAFHPYPQLIPSVFNLSGFAPPQPLTAASHWPWVDHFASGPGHATHSPSLGFGFPTATTHVLTSRHAADSQAHSSKGTPSHHKGALTDCKHTVSGTISLPSRGTFHHSLTVLIRYRSSGSIQAYQVVLADSHEISRAPCYSGTTSHHTHHGFVYGTHTPYGLALTTSSTTTMLQRPGWRPREQRIPQPRSCNPRQVSHTTGLATIRFRSPLLTESLLFSLPMGTEMFHFPTFLLAPYEFRYE